MDEKIKEAKIDEEKQAFIIESELHKKRATTFFFFEEKIWRTYLSYTLTAETILPSRNSLSSRRITTDSCTYITSSLYTSHRKIPWPVTNPEGLSGCSSHPPELNQNSVGHMAFLEKKLNYPLHAPIVGAI
ncbi:hypothetical protein AVEN_97180-1 [Araneus ventricosus]|uniref:Uncharacterized protein n=1 Tax=Araneus ventricosus TaxID=182803 RepID=A0A4Y2DEY6_ARAVE|nr:hypothetical protein AVEN_97180-1 [Araneus ventricosus]